MDKYLRSIKVVSLFEKTTKCYLTACEDKQTITLVRKQESSDPGSPPKGAEWRVKWIKGATGALSGKCRLHSFYKKALMVRREAAGEGQQSYLKVFQERWPPLEQYSNAVSEWNLSLKHISFERGLGIEAQLSIDYENQSYFLAGPKSCMMSNFAYPRLEPRTSATNLRVHDWIVLQLLNAEQLLKNKDGSKKPNSTKTSKPPPNSQPHSTTTGVTTTTTTTATSISREVAVVRGPFGNSSQLTGWQVGQVVLNYFTSATGIGGAYSTYNAGHNVNGSGTQTNGDVNVRTEVGTTRDVSVSFYSNKTSSSPLKYGG
ncbi:hypothetical protein SOVF_175760 [Spinacia oleracea]|nr:hypothetical protein SOVF_175760 [Spinacia oleracea]